ncbi:MAG: cytochrome c oxidase subunit II [Loktanella sp.]|nr:cytochrome c oxidase subunit II [Loktanella sp.]
MRGASAFIAFALLAGCDTGLSTLAPAGPVAADIAWLWWVMLAGATLITVLMVVLMVVAFGRPKDTGSRVWTHGMGLWFSLTVLTALLAAGLWVGERIQPRDDDAVVVRAHAFQWGWEFSHEAADGTAVESTDLLHIPVGVPVDVLITSEDVIHSFWVPRLAGKMDAIPGRTNRTRIQADEAGEYDGLCAEFCGLNHAGMRFSVQAHANWPPDLNEAEQ